jgi:predicted NAD-dependent protein-ADP-ribosyltransferase YbiA (DUF1768 family)
MVKSKINPEKVIYNESKNIDEGDIGFETEIYEMDIYNNTLNIAIGKEKYTYSQYDIIYYPIYLLLDNVAISKIGIFEVGVNNIQNLLKNNEIDFDKGNVLLFDNEQYIREIVANYKENELEEIEKKDNKIVEIIDKDSLKVDDNDEYDENDATTLIIPQDKKSKQQEIVNEILKDGIFEIDQYIKPPLRLLEETQKDSIEIKTEYVEKSRNKWIEKFMKNNNYDINETAGDGNCLLYVIKDAYEQIGYKTSIEKLRSMLASEVTDDLFQQYRSLYVSFLGELQSKEKEMKDIKKISNELKRRNEKTTNKEEGKELLNEAKKMIEKYNSLKVEKEDVKELLDEFKFMEGIDTLEKLKEFMQTPNYWMDTWAISTLEKLLNMKVIILSVEAYNKGDVNAVLQCGQLNDDDLNKQGNFSPDFYIMACYSGNHYNLITYKEKKIFKFSEIPYDIKVLVINKCMERNSGPYYLIRDFRNFKTKLGLSPDEGAPDYDDDETIEYDKYDPETIFVFYSKSSHNKAGKGSGEIIKQSRITEFNTLNKDSVCVDWRKKIDDSWIAPFTLDGHRWSSVEHYFQGSQYKKGFPDFYLEFSLDSESDISKDVSLAKLVGSKPNKQHKLSQKPKSSNIVIDSDFYEMGLNPRHEAERLNALMAKFTQNLDLKKVLMETKDAKLMHFERGNPAKADELLMKVRRTISSQKVEQ